MAKYIEAIRYYYGFTEKEAKAYYRKAKRNGNQRLLDLLLADFVSKVENRFYDD